MFDVQRHAMATEMEMKHCLIPRLYSYPLVKASYDQLAAGYATGKETYPTIGATLSLAEGYLRYALGAVEPLVHQIDGSLVTVEKAACQYLDKVDAAYPTVKESPEEILKNLKTYYETTRIKSGVDKTVAVKNYGTSIVTSSRDYCTTRRDALVTGVNGGLDETVQKLVGHVHGMIDMAETLLDRFVPGTSEGKQENASISERLASLYGRTASDIKGQTILKYDQIKDGTVAMVQQLTDLTILLEYAKSRQEWAAETVSSLKTETTQMLAGARDNVLRFSNKLQSVDEMSKQGYQFVFDQMTRVRNLLAGTMDYLHEKISKNMPIGPDADAEDAEEESVASPPSTPTESGSSEGENSFEA